MGREREQVPGARRIRRASIDRRTRRDKKDRRARERDASRDRVLVAGSVDRDRRGGDAQGAERAPLKDCDRARARQVARDVAAASDDGAGRVGDVSGDRAATELRRATRARECACAIAEPVDGRSVATGRERDGRAELEEELSEGRDRTRMDERNGGVVEGEPLSAGRDRVGEGGEDRKQAARARLAAETANRERAGADV